MASAGTISLVLKADTALFRASMKSVHANMGKMQASFAQFGMAAGAAFAGLALGAKKVVGAYATFDRGLVRSAAIAGATGEQTKQLEQTALGLAKQTQFTATQVTEAYGFMAMAGMKANTILGSTPAVLELAAAGALDLGSAANIVTNVMAGFGKKSNELAEVNDVMVAAITGANVDVRMLGEAFKMAGPVAKGAGMSFRDATTAIAMLGNAGIQGTLAGTSLKNALNNLLNPSDKVKEVLSRLNINVNDTNGNLRPLAEILGELASKGARAGEMMKIFGLRAGPGMLALKEQGVEAMAAFNKRLKESAGIAGNLARKEMATLSGQMQILASRVEGAQIQLGRGLAPIAFNVVQRLGDMAETVANVATEFTKIVRESGMVDFMGELLVKTTAVVGAAGGLFIFGKIFGSLLGMLKPFAGIIFNLFRALTMTLKIPLFIVAGMIAGFGALTKLLRHFGVTWTDVWNKAKALVADIAAWLYDVWIDVALGVGAVFAGATAAIQTAFSELGLHIERMFKGVVNDVLRIYNIFAEKLGKERVELFMADNPTDLGNTFKDAFNEYMKDAAFVKKNLPGTLKDAAKSVMEVGKDIGRDFGDSFMEGLDTLLGGIKSLLPENLQGLGDDLMASFKRLKAAAKPGGAGAVTPPAQAGGVAAKSGAEGVRPDADNSEARKEFWGQVVDVVSPALGEMSNSVHGFIQAGLPGAAMAAAGSIMQHSKAAKKLGDSFTAIIKTAASIIDAFEPLINIVIKLNEIISGIIGSFGNFIGGFFGAIGISKKEIISEAEARAKAAKSVREFAQSLLEGFRDKQVEQRAMSLVGADLSGFSASSIEIFQGFWESEKDRLERQLAFLEMEGLDTTDTVAALDGINGALNQGTEILEETTEGMQEGLSNVPSGLKVAATRFASIMDEAASVADPTIGTPMGGGGAATGAAATFTTPQNILDQFASAGIGNVETMIVVTDDPDRAAENILDAASNKNRTSSGPVPDQFSGQFSRAGI